MKRGFSPRGRFSSAPLTRLASQPLSVLLAFLLLFPSLAHSQTYRVAGTILSATEGHPLSRARVTLANPRTGKPIQSMITGDDGHFEFTNVPAGKYPLTGAKRGYFTAAYNQHEQFSTAIVTGAGVDTEHLTLRIAPLAQISGQVFDEHGDPIRNARVTLWQDDHSSGISRTRRFNNDTTDDLGSFEFATLPPGTYFLSVTADPWYAVHPHSTDQAGAQDFDRSLDVVYPTTYYSGATESEDATPILVRGGDRLQFDLHLLPVPALHVLFLERAGQDSFAPPMLFKRVFDDLDLPQRQDAQMVSPGLFEIITAPGRFRVSVPASGNSPARTTDVDIAQDNQELDPTSGAALATLAVAVEIPGESPLPQPLFVTLRDAKGRRVSSSQADPQGGATFNELAPGKYTLSASARNQPYAVASITPIGPGTTRGKPSSSNAVNIPAGANLSIALALIGGSSTVEGFVQQNGKAFAGAMVVLVPAHPDAHREFFRRDQSDLDGSFGLPGVVPGPYTVVAIEDGWDLDWSQPNVIARYAAHGEKLTVPANAKTLHLPTPIDLQPK
jgi:carboxypeptidase family protein